jgi:hypothetical protein
MRAGSGVLVVRSMLGQNAGLRDGRPWFFNYEQIKDGILAESRNNLKP